MLIIFDLDDTLINTSEEFLPLKLKKVVQAMIDSGLNVDEDEVLNKIMGINQNSINAEQAIKTFLQQIGQEKLLRIAIEEYYAPYEEEFKINFLPHALEVIKELKDKQHKLTLVSYGNPELQKKKLEQTGIRNIFDKIIITEEHNKGELYWQLAELLNYPPEQVVVIGDKVKTDLLPAKELGMVTIQMQCGRGKQFPAKEGEVDHSIQDLKELLKIVMDLSLE